MQAARVHNSDIEWVRAHADNVGNCVADIAAKNEAQRIAQQRVAYDPALDGWETDQVVRPAQPLRQQWLIAEWIDNTVMDTNIVTCRLVA